MLFVGRVGVCLCRFCCRRAYLGGRMFADADPEMWVAVSPRDGSLGFCGCRHVARKVGGFVRARGGEHGGGFGILF